MNGDQVESIQLKKELRDAMGPTLPPAEQWEPIRAKAGSRRKIAPLIGVSHQTLGAWESGRKRPTGANRERYAAILKLILEETA